MLPKHRRGPWSSTEDQVLLELVHTQGASNWVRISQLMQSRSPKQCRERYHQNLKGSLNLEPISHEEGILIERMVSEIGKRWAEIARRLHGRSDNAVKNWWNGGMNRRKRRDNRRAEMAPQHHAQSMRPIHQAATPPHPPPMRQLGYADPMYNAPQYRYEHHPSSAQVSHPPPPPQVYPPQCRQLPPSRPVMEAPLPSPGAASFNSRTDSSESAPPSLVSDASASSSYSQSPSFRYSSHELPSPAEQRDGYGRWIMPNHPQNAPYDGPFAPRDNNVTVLSSQPAKEHYHQPPTFTAPPAEQWRERQPRTVTPPAARPALPQLQLPGFQTLASSMSKASEPSSPPKDARMNVNALIH